MEQKTKTEEKEEKLELELVDFIPLFGAETFRKRFGKYEDNKEWREWSRGDKTKYFGMMGYHASFYLMVGGEIVNRLGSYF